MLPLLNKVKFEAIVYLIINLTCKVHLKLMARVMTHYGPFLKLKLVANSRLCTCVHLPTFLSLF